MNAVERLEAAIAKLEALKVESTPGPWWHTQADIDYSQIEDDRGAVLAMIGLLLQDGSLIVTLHRTIDAQLAILRAAADDYERYGKPPSKYFANDIALADAILGGA